MVASAEFRTSYPRTVSPEKIPDQVRSFLEANWNMGCSAAREIGVYRLKRAYLAGEGLIFDEDLRVVGPAVTQQAPEHIHGARQELAVAIEDGRLVERDGPLVLCVKPGKANYGHWLVEMLPMADLAAEVFPGESPSVLVPDVGGPMQAVISDSLALLGVPAQRVIPALRTPERIRDLIVVVGLTVHGTYMSPLVLRTLDRIASGISPFPNHERIYVRRRFPAHRRLLDDEAIAKHLASIGYVVMNPEDYSLAHQIAAFKQARQVVGPVSAALTNVAFCSPGTEAAIFYPASMVDTFYWFLAQHRKLDYLDIRCEPVGVPQTHMAHDTDLKTDPLVWRDIVASGRERIGRRAGPRWSKLLPGRPGFRAA